MTNLGSEEETLQDGQHVGGRLTRPCGRTPADIPAQQGHRYRGRLNRRGVDILQLLDGLEQGTREVHERKRRLLVVHRRVVEESAIIFVKIVIVVELIVNLLDLNVDACVGGAEGIAGGSFGFPASIVLFHLRDKACLGKNVNVYIQKVKKSKMSCEVNYVIFHHPYPVLGPPFRPDPSITYLLTST